MVVRRQILIGGGALAVAGVGATYFGLRQMGSMEEYNASIAATRASLSQTPEMRDFIRYATLAANSHNTQPWRFRIIEGQIEILPDFSRRIPVVDPDDHHMFASLGCAAENLALAAAARGQTGSSVSSLRMTAPWCSPSARLPPQGCAVRCNTLSPIDPR